MTKGDESALEALIGFILLMIGAAAVIQILQQANGSQVYVCSRCNTRVPKGATTCPHCHARLT